jgi:histidine phosphotransfer protein HptB
MPGQKLDAAERPESINSAHLQELQELTSFSNDPIRFLRLIRVFLDGLEPDLRAMRKAIEAADTRELADLAHTLKGASGSLGATYLATLCETLEETCMGADLEGAKHALRLIEHEARIVTHILKDSAMSR